MTRVGKPPVLLRVTRLPVCQFLCAILKCDAGTRHFETHLSYLSIYPSDFLILILHLDNCNKHRALVCSFGRFMMPARLTEAIYLSMLYISSTRRMYRDDKSKLAHKVKMDMVIMIEEQKNKCEKKELISRKSFDFLPTRLEVDGPEMSNLIEDRSSVSFNEKQRKFS